ncbi:MAG: hypothetical protein WCG85_09625 [Polyangia bacterium]
MSGQRRILTVLLGGLLLVGCGSGGSRTQVDAPVEPTQYSEAGTTAPADAPDTVSPSEPDAGAVCDEDAMGESYCIINPGTTVGGGTPVARLNPAPYQTCRPF